jgi:hypothetical protein
MINEDGAQVGVALSGLRLLHATCGWTGGDHLFFGDDTGALLLRLQAYGVEWSRRADEPRGQAHRLTQTPAEGLTHFRLYTDAADGPTWEARCKTITLFPDARDDVYAFMLSDEQREHVTAALRAVVDRDVAAVASMLADPGDADHFWEWADDVPERSRLVMPDVAFTDWEITGFYDSRDRSSMYLHAEMRCESGETDLTLRMTLHDLRSGPQIELEDLHVM